MKERIAFIGLGTMGLPMARDLLKCGYEVTGYDVFDSQLKLAVEAGARAASSPAAATADCDVLITMLPNARDVETAIVGPNGAYEGMREGTIHIDSSTIEPSSTKRFSALAAERGLRMLDAAVGKSSAAAIDGSLTFMVGAEPADLEKIRAILNAMGTTVYHCGPVGMGEVVKLVNNFISGGIVALVAEAVVLGAKAGADVRVIADVLKDTGAGNWQLENTFRQRVFRGAFEPGFKIRLMHKDAGLARSMASELGVPTPIFALVKEIYSTAMGRGLGDEDWGALTKLVEEASGVEARYAPAAAGVVKA